MMRSRWWLNMYEVDKDLGLPRAPPVAPGISIAGDSAGEDTKGEAVESRELDL